MEENCENNKETTCLVYQIKQNMKQHDDALKKRKEASVARLTEATKKNVDALKKEILKASKKGYCKSWLSVPVKSDEFFERSDETYYKSVYIDDFKDINISASVTCDHAELRLHADWCHLKGLSD